MNNRHTQPFSFFDKSTGPILRFLGPRSFSVVCQLFIMVVVIFHFLATFILLKYCRFGRKHHSFNQSFSQSCQPNISQTLHKVLRLEGFNFVQMTGHALFQCFCYKMMYFASLLHRSRSFIQICVRASWERGRHNRIQRPVQGSNAGEERLEENHWRKVQRDLHVQSTIIICIYSKTFVIRYPCNLTPSLLWNKISLPVYVWLDRINCISNFSCFINILENNLTERINKLLPINQGMFLNVV